MVFARHDTLDKTAATSAGMTDAGTVVYREGNDVLLLAPVTSEPSLKFASCMQQVLTGMSLDGEDHTITIRHYYSSQTATTVGTFTYACTDIEEFTAALDTWLRANEVGMKWHAEYMEDYTGTMQCTIVMDYYTQWYHGNGVVAGSDTGNVGVSVTYANGMTAFSTARTKGKMDFSFPAANRYSYLGRATANGRTPTSLVSVTDTTEAPILPECYLDSTNEAYAYTASLREKFGEGTEGYMKYIESRRVLLSSDIGQGQRLMAENMRKYTAMLGQKTHLNIDGEETVTFPFAHYCYTYAVGSNALTAAGQWEMMAVRDTYIMMSKVLYCTNTTWVNYGSDTDHAYSQWWGEWMTTDRSAADKLNVARYKMGTAAVNLAANRWSGGRTSATGAWFWYGGGGYLSYGYFFYHSFPVCAALHVDLNDLED